MSSPSPTTQWNPADYAANSAVQLAWARELISRLHLRGDEHILDVGCGDGKITAELAQSVPRGSATGIDASASMIDFARAKFPHQQFQVMDARAIRFDQKFDLVFSNAALHWVDDHEAFLRGAAAVLRPGGRLIISCGGKGNAQAVVVVFHSVMRHKCWRNYFRDMPAPYFFYPPEQYQAWLARAHFQPHQVDLAPKDAFYDGVPGLAAWLRTAWLPYTQRVPASEREKFINEVAEGYVAKYRPDTQGRVMVRMVRLEIIAGK